MSRKSLAVAMAACVIAFEVPAAASSADRAAAAIAAAIADPGRPAADVARDPERKPAALMAFAEVRPGEVVAEILPGGGYFTRIFSKAVGPGGRVYAVIPEALAKGDKPPAVNAIAADPAYANVKVAVQDFAALHLPEPVDLVWTSLNYHDLHLARFRLDVAATDKAIYAALKPGGVFLVVDHAAVAGTGLDVPDKLHRIDEAIVKREVEAAGFKLEAESQVLRNPADDRQKAVFDPSVRGRTDQFVLRFRKPS